MARFWNRRRRGRGREPALLMRVRGACPRCGYSLQGIEDARRCPECGRKLLVATRRGALPRRSRLESAFVACCIVVIAVAGSLGLAHSGALPRSLVQALILMALSLVMLSIAGVWWPERPWLARGLAMAAVAALVGSAVVGLRG